MTNLENALVDQNERIGLPISENGGFLGTKFNQKVSTEQALKLSGLDYIVKSEPHSTIENYRDFYFERENGKKDYFHSTSLLNCPELEEQAIDVLLQFKTIDNLKGTNTNEYI